MAIQFKNTKPKKEKPVKAFKEPKAPKLSKSSNNNLSFKYKATKPKKEKSEKISKGGSIFSSKIEKQKSSISIDGLNDKKTKSKKIKVFILVAAIILAFCFHFICVLSVHY